MEKAIKYTITLPWEEFQAKVREYATRTDYEVSPITDLSLDEARVQSLSLYTPGALVSSVDFHPYFKSNGADLKFVVATNINEKDKGITALLTELNAMEENHL